MGPPGDYHDYNTQRVGSGVQRPGPGGAAKGQTNNQQQQKSAKELPTQALAHNMKMQLQLCLRTHNLNYLTAAYYLTQKHEFS